MAAVPLKHTAASYPVIRGYFDARTPAMPKVQVGVFVPGITTEWVFIDFLIDTGASNTCIHPLDAISRLNIDPVALGDEREWIHPERCAGVGGEATYFRIPTSYLFPTDAGQWIQHRGYWSYPTLVDG